MCATVQQVLEARKNIIITSGGILYLLNVKRNSSCYTSRALNFCWFIHLSKTIPIDVVTYCPLKATSWEQCFSFSKWLYPVSVGREMQKASPASLTLLMRWTRCHLAGGASQLFVHPSGFFGILAVGQFPRSAPSAACTAHCSLRSRLLQRARWAGNWVWPFVRVYQELNSPRGWKYFFHRTAVQWLFVFLEGGGSEGEDSSRYLC